MPSLIDASSAIHGWEHYPIELFPDLWQWLAEQIEYGEIQCIQLIMQEIKHKLPECFDWLESYQIEIIPIDDPITQKASEIGGSLGLDGSSYHSKGIDENDIFLIATAAVTNNAVISNEAIQLKPPDNIQKSKIPLVCKGQSVQCYSFLAYFTEHWGRS